MGAWIEISSSLALKDPAISRTLYGCVDWNMIGHKQQVHPGLVAPFMGAWIEIQSHQMGKYKTLVAPFMGAWIEIHLHYLKNIFQVSRTLYGCVDWNHISFISLKPKNQSHPLWVRGLKSPKTPITLPAPLVAPFMGAWIEIQSHQMGKYKTLVAPFMGAWIEINSFCMDPVYFDCRTLYGCVDWNTTHHQ